MGVFAHGCFSDFIIMGVLVARFAHVTGFGRVCCWPTLVCVAEGGGEVSGFAHGWSSCCLNSGTCVGWFALGSDIGA